MTIVAFASFFFFLYGARALPTLHSFPTRRSSDLDEAEKILDLMQEEKSEEVQEILEYPEHSAGRVLWILQEDRKSTRLNSSHVAISYAVFCLKKKKKQENPPDDQNNIHHAPP